MCWAVRCGRVHGGLLATPPLQPQSEPVACASQEDECARNAPDDPPGHSRITGRAEQASGSGVDARSASDGSVPTPNRPKEPRSPTTRGQVSSAVGLERWVDRSGGDRRYTATGPGHRSLLRQWTGWVPRGAMTDQKVIEAAAKGRVQQQSPARGEYA